MCVCVCVCVRVCERERQRERERERERRESERKKEALTETLRGRERETERERERQRETEREVGVVRHGPHPESPPRTAAAVGDGHTNPIRDSSDSDIHVPNMKGARVSTAFRAADTNGTTNHNSLRYCGSCQYSCRQLSRAKRLRVFPTRSCRSWLLWLLHSVDVFRPL